MSPIRHVVSGVEELTHVTNQICGLRVEELTHVNNQTCGVRRRRINKCDQSDLWCQEEKNYQM